MIQLYVGLKYKSSDTFVYGPSIRALLGTASSFIVLGALATQIPGTRAGNIPLLSSDDVFRDTFRPMYSSGPNVIPRRARPGLAGLFGHSPDMGEWTRPSVQFSS